EVIDYVGGQKDLMKKVIRTVGQPVARFEEDKLRILRALRFLSQLGFEIDRDTQEAMQLWKHKLDQVSMERVRDEWGKLLLGEHRLKALELSDKLKIFSVLFPQWTFMPLQYRSLLSDKAYEPSVLWAMWMLIHLKERQSIAEEGLRWKLSRDLIKDIIFCYDQMTHIREFANRDAADFAIFMGTTRGKFAVKVYRNINRPQAERWKSKFKEASQYFVDGKLPKPVVNGDDLIQYGMQPGPMVSEMLHRIYYKQLKEGISHKEELMKILAEEEN
ncbi:MAG: hypothetical protein KDD33_09280, partial [Bdellovibrionales bacterium]|nr:hypothetical protein [Bdellovibrionales bacterium]